jgi:hypothetical protein
VHSQADTGSAPTSPARGIAGQIAANISLLIAILFYMGWAYDDAFYGYFHLNPLDLNLSIQEYILRSLDLFSTTIVIVAVAFIALAAARSWSLGKTKFALLAADTAATRMSAIPAFRGLVSTDAAERARARRVILIGTGAVVTLIALALYWMANYVAVSSYLFLWLLGSGVLLMTWPTRTERHGRFAYATAIVVTAVCALWAAALYAHNLGTQTAQEAVQDLSGHTAVSVYSVDRLALAGPGVIVQNIPANYYYHYCYTGLRMLLMQSGTYYLLPVDWNPGLDLTYILNQSDLIRIQLGGRGCFR